MKTIIFDIDGTLSDPEHRRHHVRNGNKNWDSFLALAHADPVIQPIATLARLVSTSGMNVVCCTGRGEEHRGITEAWLKEHNIPYTKLYMRAAGDNRADHVVKSELLDQMYAEGLEPILAIDDRSSVVNMWRQRGIICLQCTDWDETKSLAGTTLDLLVGPYKAGKTDYARRTFPRHSVLSMHEFALDLQADIFKEEKYDDTVSAIRSVAKVKINHALPTVVEAFNIRKKERTATALLGLPNCRVRYHVLNRPMQDKLKACKTAEEESLVRFTEQSFTSQLRDILAGDNLDIEVLDLRT